MNAINIGDKVKYDGNIHGIKPRIGFAAIKAIKSGFASHGCTNPGKVFKVVGDNGCTFCIDENQIITD